MPGAIPAAARVPPSTRAVCNYPRSHHAPPAPTHVLYHPAHSALAAVATALGQALLDSIGPRLTGSPGMTSASDWAIAPYKQIAPIFAAVLAVCDRQGLITSARTPATTPVRNVAFFPGRVSTRHVNHTAFMRDWIDSPEGRAKVDTRWKLYCLVHNIEKLANNGYAA